VINIVHTTGNPDSRSERSRQVQEGIIVSQISQPINWKSQKQYAREQYNNNKEFRRKQLQRSWEAGQNKELTKAQKDYRKKYRLEHREEEKKYRLEHREELIRKQYEYRILPEVKAKTKIKDAKKYQLHKEEIKKRIKERYRNNPELRKQRNKYIQRMKEEYYNKGTTKKKELIKKHLTAKEKIGFSYQNLDSLV